MEQMTLERIEETLDKLNLSEEEQVDWLRERCDEFNIEYHHKAGYAKLITLLLAHYNKDVKADTEETKEVSDKPIRVEDLEFKSLDRYVDETDTDFAARKRKEAHRLVRVRITCMNPVKKELQGEVFTIANDLFTIKRMIPFHGNPTHIEVAFLDMLRERKFQQFRETRKSSLSEAPMQEGYLVPEFAIEVMSHMTPEEMERLAIEQARSNRVG
jgi:hypothetical protein